MVVEPDADHVLWLDGEFVPWRAATMHVTAHHYGYGVFEGVRSYEHEGAVHVFRLQDHTARLFRSAKCLNIPIPPQYDPRRLEEVQLELLRRNHLGDAYLRPFVFYGGTAGLSRNVRGLPVHVAVIALAWRTSEPARPVALRTSSYTRGHANGVLWKAKANANYMNGMLALQEAQAAGADEALLLDARGFVTETSGSNLFVVRNGVLFTPPLELALEGITRDTVFSLARSFGWTVLEKHLTRDDVYVADEVFVTGTAVEIAAVGQIDGREPMNGAPGPMTRKLRAAYSALVRGRGEQNREWLTRV